MNTIKKYFKPINILVLFIIFIISIGFISTLNPDKYRNLLSILNFLYFYPFAFIFLITSFFNFLKSKKQNNKQDIIFSFIPLFLLTLIFCYIFIKLFYIVFFVEY